MKLLLVLIGVICCLCAFVHSETITLPSLSIVDVTISGISSGGYMAVQMHIAYSSIFSGSAIFAAGPYYCSQDDLNIGVADCMYGTVSGPDPELLVNYTRTFEAEGKIDSTSNLSNDEIFLYVGQLDTVVDPIITKALEKYYLAFVDQSRINSVYDFPSQHTFPTLSYGNPCDTLASPYLGLCQYDGAGVALKHLYKDAKLNDAVKSVPSNFFEFDQTPYIPSTTVSSPSIGSVGYLYVPTSCQDGTTACHLHVSLHGCNQNSEWIGNVYAANVGMNEWAESNNIVVLYPNTANTKAKNPQGCWDWWGYTDSNFAFKSGVQMQFIANMVTALGFNNN